MKYERTETKPIRRNGKNAKNVSIKEEMNPASRKRSATNAPTRKSVYKEIVLFRKKGFGEELSEEKNAIAKP